MLGISSRTGVLCALISLSVATSEVVVTKSWLTASGDGDGGGEVPPAVPAVPSVPVVPDGPAEGITSLGKNLLWVAFFCLFIPSLYFFMDMLRMPEESRKYHVITFGVCAIASLAYLTMATGMGYYVRSFDGRMFFFARYIDWVFTTPLQLLDVLGFAGAGNDVTSFVIGIDILMIVAGLIGGFLPGNDKYYFWTFGVLMFLPILYYLIFGLKDCAMRKPAAVQSVFIKISLLTAISWTAYPVVWILAEGTDILSTDVETICYTVLDILAKSVFGFIIIMARDACNQVNDTIPEARGLINS